jgi:hypothetical protein
VFHLQPQPSRELAIMPNTLRRHKLQKVGATEPFVFPVGMTYFEKDRRVLEKCQIRGRFLLAAETSGPVQRRPSTFGSGERSGTRRGDVDE